MALVLDYLYIGDRKIAKNYELLTKDLNIHHILNITPPRSEDPVAGVPNFFEKDGRFKYLRCPIYDNTSSDVSIIIDKCIAFIRGGRHHGSVLVHCNKGVSRSSSVIIAYLMKEYGMTLDKSLNLIRQNRPQANPNASFMKQLERLEIKYNKNEMIEEKKKNMFKFIEPVELNPVGALCEECEEKIAKINCTKCHVNYCFECSSSAHKDDAMGNHEKYMLKFEPKCKEIVEIDDGMSKNITEETRNTTTTATNLKSRGGEKNTNTGSNKTPKRQLEEGINCESVPLHINPSAIPSKDIVSPPIRKKQKH